MKIRDEQGITKTDAAIMVFLWGASGISYLVNLGLSYLNSYYAKPIQNQFKQQLDFISKNKEPEKKEDHHPDDPDDKNISLNNL